MMNHSTSSMEPSITKNNSLTKDWLASQTNDKKPLVCLSILRRFHVPSPVKVCTSANSEDKETSQEIHSTITIKEEYIDTFENNSDPLATLEEAL